MNLDHILSVLNAHEVRYLLIGGMNFLLRHKPVLTFDVDFWIEDQPDNLCRCEAALAALDAEWGASEADWAPVSRLSAGWLQKQPMYCLTSPHGAIDIFRSVRGLESWKDSFSNAISGQTAAGVSYRGICDADMLRCQLSLAPGDQKLDRIRDLRQQIDHHG